MGKTPAQEMAKQLAATKKKMAEERKKTKCKEDLAFGIKNAKGAKQAINVDRLRAAAAKAGMSKEDLAREEAKKEAQRQRAAQKKLEKAGWTQEELLLGKKVVDVKQLKLDPGVDPKTVLCGFFKAGKCRKGKQCKFSHDLDIERTQRNKRNLYTGGDRETDTMDKWDQEKLETVVGQREKTNPNATEIVCKYFLEAIETKKYGWFWKCINGDACLYQHKLPIGFILKSDLEEEEKEENEEDISDRIDNEIAALDRDNLTPVTLENFMVWKEKAKKAKEEAMMKEAMENMKKKNKTKSKQHRSGMTGRALFTYRPNLFQDDEDAAADDDYAFEGDEEEVKEEVTETTKEWKAEVEIVDKAEFERLEKELETLKLEPEPEEKEEVVEAVVEEKPAEPTPEEIEAEKKKKAEEAAAKRKAKAEEKRLKKLADKAAKNVRPLTAFEKKQAIKAAEEEAARIARELAAEKEAAEDWG